MYDRLNLRKQKTKKERKIVAMGIYTLFNKLVFIVALGLLRAMSCEFIVGETKRIMLKIELECSFTYRRRSPDA